jgi:hypothetical protein
MSPVQQHANRRANTYVADRQQVVVHHHGGAVGLIWQRRSGQSSGNGKGVMNLATSRILAMRMVAVAICFALSACAGYRGGWESIPYIGAPPPTPSVSRTNYERGERLKLAIPGLALSVMLHNSSLDSDTLVYAYVVPVPGPLAGASSDAPKTATATLFITPREEGYVFRPLFVTLSVGGQTVSALGAYTNAKFIGYKDGKAVHSVPQRIADEFPLRVGTSYIFDLEFPSPAPSAQAPDVALDLSKGLHAPGQPTIPLIRFLPVRWGNWYG